MKKIKALVLSMGITLCISSAAEIKCKDIDLQMNPKLSYKSKKVLVVNPKFQMEAVGTVISDNGITIKVHHDGTMEYEDLIYLKNEVAIETHEPIDRITTGDIVKTMKYNGMGGKVLAVFEGGYAQVRLYNMNGDEYFTRTSYLQKGFNVQ